MKKNYIQKSLFLDQVRTEVCNNIVKHCMLQDIKERLPKRVRTLSIKKSLKGKVGCLLHLSLKKEPFDVMVTGEKNEEFRKNSDWIRSRLIHKDDNEKEYDYIKFVNGYGADKPYFICKYEGFMECYMNVAERKYSNGLSITGIGKGDFIIYCGEIIEIGNLGFR